MKKSLIFLISIFAFTTMTASAQTSNGIWYKPQKGDGTWRVSEKFYGTGVNYDTLRKVNNLTRKSGPNKNWVYDNVQEGILMFIPDLHPEPQPEFKRAEFVAPDPIQDSLSWWENLGLLGWILIIIIIFLLFVIIVNSFRFDKLKKDAEEELGKSDLENQRLNSEINLLKRANKELSNKLPVETPELVDSEWLTKNSPMGDPIPNEPTAEVITKAFGKYPHLVIQAKVTTHPKSAEMGFSHDRKALTGLDGVVAYLGWDWDNETKTWNEVGYVAGPCANGFVFTPEAIEKGMTFSKIELVASKSPVVMTDVKADAPKYPELIWPLIQEYHRLNITEQRMAGMVVYVPKPKKAPVAETQTKTSLN